LKLKIINNVRVDHGSKGFKDGADALAGAVYQCMMHLDTEVELEIEIWNDVADNEEMFEALAAPQKVAETVGNIPSDIEEWLMEVL